MGEPAKTLSEQSAQLLRVLGFPPHRKSFRYLSELLSLALRQEGGCTGAGRRMYAEVARRCGVSAAAVERSVRQAIARRWQEGDPAVLKRFFPKSTLLGRPFPTNGVFVFVLTDYLMHCPAAAEKSGEDAF